MPRWCRRRGGASAASVIAVVAFVASVSSRALAEEGAAAGTAAVSLSEQRAGEAFQAYTKGDFATAVGLYLSAYEAAPSGSILYNIARIYDLKLADRPLAINFYRRYIADPGAQAELIQVAKERLGELHDADLAASKPTDQGPTSASARMERRTGSPRPLGEAVQKQRNAWSSLRWVGVAVAAVGVASVGVGGGFGLTAMSRQRTANDACDGNACTTQAGVDAAHAARRAATVSNIGFAAGGALLATGAAMFFLGGDRQRERGSRADIRVGTWATASAASLQISGRW
jgi:hypothetical protein